MRQQLEVFTQREEVFPHKAVFQSEVIYLTFLRGGEVIAGKYWTLVSNSRGKMKEWEDVREQ